MEKKFDYTDTQLVEGALKGDRTYQELLYRKFAKKMFGVCRGYANDEPGAKDILQEGFLKVFNNLHQYRNGNSLEGWIRRIIVNTAIDHYRKNTRERIIDIEERNSEPAESAILEKINCDELLHLIQQLPHGARMVLNMYSVEGYSHKEIAEILKISEGTSKSQLSRAKKILQELISKA